MINKIKQLAKKLNIDLIGFTNVESFSEMVEKIKSRQESGQLCNFGEKSIEKMTQPLLVWDKAKSIISIGISYNHILEKNNLNNAEKCKISRVSWGIDYHEYLMNKMEKLMEGINKEVCTMKYKAYVDNAPLMDRAVAYRSGIGFFGKSGFIINPELGSYIFLGHILVDKEIDNFNKPLDPLCNECEKCIQACPTGALYDEYSFDANKCISYLTQTKELLNRQQRKSIGSYIYGCDICQEVCPYNKNAIKSLHNAFKPEITTIYPNIKDILEMNNKEFNIKYKNTSCGWRGKKILQRNVIIVAGNIKSTNNYEMLKQMLEDPRWDIRLYTLFSLYEYGDIAIEVIEKQLKRENEEFNNYYRKYRD